MEPPCVLLATLGKTLGKAARWELPRPGLPTLPTITPVMCRRDQPIIEAQIAQPAKYQDVCTLAKRNPALPEKKNRLHPGKKDTRKRPNCRKQLRRLHLYCRLSNGTRFSLNSLGLLEFYKPKRKEEQRSSTSIREQSSKYRKKSQRSHERHRSEDREGCRLNHRKKHSSKDKAQHSSKNKERHGSGSSSKRR